jgi:hypothetical protein
VGQLLLPPHEHQCGGDPAYLSKASPTCLMASSDCLNDAVAPCGVSAHGRQRVGQAVASLALTMEWWRVRVQELVILSAEVETMRGVRGERGVGRVRAMVRDG